jgi:hypothetical protein
LTHLQNKAHLAEKESERLAAQNELDDLLMVFGDLEEKVAQYKVVYHDSISFLSDF